jgi:alanyl-tRNA synthetase
VNNRETVVKQLNALLKVKHEARTCDFERYTCRLAVVFCRELPIEVNNLMVVQVKPEELPTRVQTLQEELRASNKEAAALRAELALAKADSLSSNFETVGSKNVRYFILDSSDLRSRG